MPSTPNGSGNKTETKEGRSTGLIANHVKSENDTDTNTKNSNSSGDSKLNKDNVALHKVPTAKS